MRIFLLITFVFLGINIGTSQELISQKKFNLKFYHKYLISDTNYFYLNDSSKVTISQSNSGYQILIDSANTWFNRSYQYDLNSKKLIRSGQFFQREPIGKHLIYKANGRLLKVDDYNDPSFSFTFEQLVEKLKLEIGKDIINKKSGVGVYIINHNHPIYNIHFLTETYRISRFIQIDGKTGEIRQDFTKSRGCGITKNLEPSLTTLPYVGNKVPPETFYLRLFDSIFYHQFNTVFNEIFKPEHARLLYHYQVKLPNIGPYLVYYSTISSTKHSYQLNKLYGYYNPGFLVFSDTILNISHIISVSNSFYTDSNNDLYFNIDTNYVINLNEVGMTDDYDPETQEQIAEIYPLSHHIITISKSGDIIIKKNN